MDYYLCNVCGTVFDGRMIKENEYLYTSECPISSCCGDIFQCDEEMLVPISILNRKGYITDFCCSGHIYNTNSGGGYISFFEGCSPDCEPPKGWYKDNSVRPVIRYDLKGHDYIKRLKERHRKIDALVKWCEELEEAEEI